MRSINITLSDSSYDIIIENDLIDNIADKLKFVYEGNKIAIITDNNLYALYGERLKHAFAKSDYNISFIVIEAGEASKSIKGLEYVYNKLASEGLTRTDLILSFGGGVVGDLAGFAASSYLRGLMYIQVPTSLLAQVDSSIGGKTAINLEHGKNLVGSFYHPTLVLIDTNVLNSLPNEQIKAGMAEVIKYACIEDKDFWISQ